MKTISENIAKLIIEEAKNRKGNFHINSKVYEVLMETNKHIINFMEKNRSKK